MSAELFNLSAGPANRLLMDFVPDCDATVVQKLDAAGACGLIASPTTELNYTEGK
jgi:Asp-tRNA(Asn)/Glu-tRNA(Gln) amidotransferase A subunit family amidase